MNRIVIAILLLGSIASAKSLQNSQNYQDLLIKFAPGAMNSAEIFAELKATGSKTEVLGVDNWVRVQIPNQEMTFEVIEELRQNPMIESVQKNYKLKLLENYQIKDPIRRAALLKHINKMNLVETEAAKDNPEIPQAPQNRVGNDPDFSKQWGMKDIGVQSAWQKTMGSPEMVVAVIDTGVDYTHEDLLPNMWRNPNEIPNNNIDDDNNGYVDDVVGWDFAANDNKPYDLSVGMFDLLLGGGNPGHGTHCAGNVAARANNAIGIAGVAPNVKIMALRFLTEKGSGTTADAIKAIRYGVDNGAQVLSNSWGSEGEDSEDPTGNQALKDAIQYAQDNNVLFVAAAGNGHNGVGYDNDSDARPAYPASYKFDTMLSVAALDVNNNLGSFSNWGKTTVHIGAPGVAVFSTTVGNKYSDTVINFPGMKITWDGTSMATPHVAGAAALYWSANPTKTYLEVKNAIMDSAVKIPALTGKSVSEGKLNVEALMNQ